MSSSNLLTVSSVCTIASATNASHESSVNPQQRLAVIHSLGCGNHVVGRPRLHHRMIEPLDKGFEPCGL